MPSESKWPLGRRWFGCGSDRPCSCLPDIGSSYCSVDLAFLLALSFLLSRRYAFWRMTQTHRSPCCAMSRISSFMTIHRRHQFPTLRMLMAQQRLHGLLQVRDHVQQLDRMLAKRFELLIPIALGPILFALSHVRASRQRAASRQSTLVHGCRSFFACCLASE